MNLILASGMEVFTTILYVILAIMVLLLMVLIHEFGQYVVGRLLNFKITEFSIGFGKAIFQRKNKRGELISLRIFPLGGYCAFAGENDEDDEKDKDKSSAENNKIEDSNDQKIEENKIESIKEEKTKDEKEKVIELDKNNEPKKGTELLFNEQKPWKRLLVYGAGVFFNFLSAIIFSFILLVSFGYDIPQVKAVDNTKIEYVGSEVLQEGDVIWKVNGEKISFAFSGTISQLISKPFNQNTEITDSDVVLSVNRDGQMIDVTIKVKKVTETVDDSEVTKLQTGFETKAYVHSFWDALGRCFELAFGFGWVVLKGFWQIITGQVGFSELGGPISTIGMITTITQSGWANFFILLPLLAANLAIFNFLPIPALDGCHALFTLLEWIFRKPVVSRKVEGYIHFYGLLALLLLVVIADIVHISVVGFPKL